MLWLVARLSVMAMYLAIAVTSGGPIATKGLDVRGPMVPPWVLVVTGTLLFVDLHRRKELVLFHNLGVPTGTAVALGFLPAVLLEVVLVTVVP